MTDKTISWRRRLGLIPDGCSTMSKMPSRYVNRFHPKYWDRAQGARCYVGDREYIDYTLGLGAVILGYGDPHLRSSFIDQYDKGTIHSVPCEAEAELAAKLRELVPSAEMTRFTNTGTEACTAAVKIARAYTGRERLLYCGYHGWNSWYAAATPDNLGCIEAEKAAIAPFTYNDLASLDNAFKAGPLPAAVIMEPYVLDEPGQGWLKQVRMFCNRYQIPLIYDEVVTGFRTPNWTAQGHWRHVKPDLTCLGKAMSNGVVPISAVCGKKEYMEMVTKGCFVSSTFAANPLACRMALETIRWMDELGVINHIWQYGERFKTHFERLVSARSLEGVSIRGLPCRTWFDFPTEAHKSLFWQECLRQGVWFGYAQFICWAHQQPEFDRTVIAMKQALQVVAANWNDPLKVLEGDVAQATFRLVAGKEKP